MKKLLGIAALMLAFTPFAQAQPFHHHHHPVKHHHYHHHHR
ncbi:hypothetical protein [Glaciimonas soli]|nr:hypothetical protein [Glaciimonas soli]